jgi:hypothetical protein
MLDVFDFSNHGINLLKQQHLTSTRPLYVVNLRSVYHIYHARILVGGHAVSFLVQALCHKLEGSGFDSR